MPTPSARFMQRNACPPSVGSWRTTALGHPAAEGTFLDSCVCVHEGFLGALLAKWRVLPAISKALNIPGMRVSLV
jgi:hypothetical protein